MVLRQLGRGQHERLDVAQILHVLRGQEDVLQRGNGARTTFSVRLPAAAKMMSETISQRPLDVPGRIQFLNPRGLAVGVVLAGLGELGLLGGELLDDLVDLRLRGLRRVRRETAAARAETIIRVQMCAYGASFVLRRDRTRPVSEQLLGDGQSLHVAGALVDPADLGVAVQLFDRVVLGKADAAEDLDGSRGHLFGDLRA